jgi:hypothetical protein
MFLGCRLLLILTTGKLASILAVATEEIRHNRCAIPKESKPEQDG